MTTAAEILNVIYRAIIRQKTGREIKPSDSMEHFGLDSIEFEDALMDIEQDLHIDLSGDRISEHTTISDLVERIQKKLETKEL